MTVHDIENTVSILFWNPCTTDWDNQIIKPVGNYPKGVFVGDANNDGYNDVVTANSGNVNVSIYLWGYKEKPPIIIESPESKIYTEPTSGYYLATYGFESDLNWFEEIDTLGGTVKIIEELNGHKKVLDLHDTSDMFNVRVCNNIYETPTNGTIEYWMRTDDVSKLSGFRLDNGANFLLATRTWNNNLQGSNGTTWKNITVLQNNTWYHMRIDFESTLGLYQGLSQYTWQLYINDTKYGEFNFVSEQAQADRVW